MSITTKLENWLVSGKPITPMQAINMWKCTRLAARINDLRKLGYKIITISTSANGKRFAKYYLID